MTKVAAITTAGATPIGIGTALAAPIKVDRAGLKNRLNQIGMYYPKVTERIDQLVKDIDWTVATSEGADELIEMVSAVERSTGDQVSIDWIVIGDGTHPNGEPIKMLWNEKPVPSKAASMASIAGNLPKLDNERIFYLSRTVKAMADGDWAEARAWRDFCYRKLGISNPQV